VQVATVRLHSAGPAGRPPAGIPEAPDGRPAASGATHPDAIELVATLYLPEGSAGPYPGLVVGHGAGSLRARHAAFCREACGQGFAVLGLDFRGHGDSGGAADGPLEDDIAAAATFLREHPAVHGEHICYRGSSMGGFYGLKAATTGALAAVALLCPADEGVLLGLLDELPSSEADTEAPEVTQLAEAPGWHGRRSTTHWDVPNLKAYFLRQDSLALAAQVWCPVLLVHARGDEAVPFGHSLALMERLGGDATLVALAGGSHTSAQHDPAVHRLTARWLLDQVRSACTERT
jgi:dipeptidyl aminopeptidase/acylaminoacyl peptidase